jgi:hypothetical protein
MEIDNVKTYINGIIAKFKEIEKTKNDMSEETIEWINEITYPLYKLTDDIVILLSDPVTKNDKIKELYHVLRKFLEIPINDEIKEQLLQNQKCLQTLTSYIATYDNENKEMDFSIDAFYVFIYLFSFYEFSPYLNEDCMNGLFEGLSLINEDKVLLIYVNILIGINCDYLSEQDNMFLKVYHYHDNARVIVETILRILNSPNEEDGMKINALYTINTIMVQEKKNIFYSTDLDAFIDISLSLLGSQENPVKLFTLQALENITSYDDYFRNNYKIEELENTMENLIYNEEDKLKEFAQNILENIESRKN